mmetsp:Transcript_29229/g.61170  ORF Transcript_29229/g.61170 Transcript_29229/m.61170 type:complete len:81 (+) Transcript_29229:1590-1832(+)
MERHGSRLGGWPTQNTADAATTTKNKKGTETVSHITNTERLDDKKVADLLIRKEPKRRRFLPNEQRLLGSTKAEKYPPEK